MMFVCVMVFNVTFNNISVIIFFSFPVIEMKQDMFTVYETEEVSIVCNEIRNNKNYGEPYWERIDGNGKSCNLTIIEELFHKYIVRYYKVSHGIQVS
jgi:hypothetical protein